MQLYAAGWKSVYVPKILTRGLVPATQSAYYKQQFKWSRGTFELLLHVYPGLFKKFTLRQKLHYFLMPLHYVVGIITLIDILIPIISLFSGYTPLLINLNMLAMTLIPLLVIILLIRQYAQRWLVEKYEYGFHATGGILLFSTWWVYVSGLLFTVFRKKVLYIATPKAEEHKNSLLLSLPNAIVSCISLAAIIYGLQRDWSPYSFFMAGFCFINVLMLVIVIFAGQLRMIWTFRQTITKIRFLRGLLRA